MGRSHLHEQQVPKDPTIYSPDHAIRQDHPVLASVSRGYPRLAGSLTTCYSPVRHFTRLATFTCDLHASSTPPTFVLSQDQTLHLKDVVQCLPLALARGGWPIRLTPSRLDFAHTLDFEATLNAKDRPLTGLFLASGGRNLAIDPTASRELPEKGNMALAGSPGCR